MPTNPAAPSSFGRKQLQKCVDVKFIRDWVPERAHRRIDIVQAWKIVRDQYCAALVARGVCPIECHHCRDEIVDMFRLKDAKNPPALLTWLAKDHSARMIEHLIETEKRGEQFPAPETPGELYDALFPKREPTDLFAKLLKDYSDEST